MNKKIIIVLASFSLTFSQSIADLNSQLNKIKSDLQSNVVNKQAQSIGKVDVASKPVVISKKNNKSPNDLFSDMTIFKKILIFLTIYQLQQIISSVQVMKLFYHYGER